MDWFSCIICITCITCTSKYNCLICFIENMKTVNHSLTHLLTTLNQEMLALLKSGHHSTHFFIFGKLVMLCLFSLCLAHCICIACKFIWHLWQSWFGKRIFRQKVKILIFWIELLFLGSLILNGFVSELVITSEMFLCFLPLYLAKDLVSHIHRLTSLPTYKVVLRDDSWNLLEKLTTTVCLCLVESKYFKNKEEELLIFPRICWR